MTTVPPPIAPSVNGIARRANLSYDDFCRDYLFPHVPVVVGGALHDWPAVGKWTPEFFKNRFGDRTVVIDREYTVAELIDQIDVSDAGRPGPYLHSQHIQHLFPEVLDDVRPLPAYFSPNWLSGWFIPKSLRERCHEHCNLEIFIGGKDAGFPFLHWDEYHYHAFVAQVYGRKKFFIYSPAQSPVMYPTADRAYVSSVRDVEHPDLMRFPRFAEARPLTTILEPGDLLFVPGGWWHTTRMLSASISVSINTVNASNWRAFSRDICDEMRPFHGRRVALFAAWLAAQGRIQASWNWLRGSR
ncbi:MAG: cupin-like domain-containing protein [Gemmataceae bacterium]